MARPSTGIKERIVRAARARFLVEGVDGASMRHIARDARTSLGMISYHFVSKDELFSAAIEEVYVRLLADLEASVASCPSVKETLRAVFTRLGKVSDEELAVLRLIAREALLSSERLARILDRAQRGHLRLIAALLQQGVQSAEIDASLPLPLAFVCTAAMGVLPQLYRRAFAESPPFGALPDVQALANLQVDLLFRALAPPDASAREKVRKRARAGAAPKKKEQTSSKRKGSR